MNYDTFKGFVTDHNYGRVDYEGETYYVLPDADEDDWQVFLMINENDDDDRWTYAITCRITRDEDGDVEDIVEVLDVEETA